MNIFVILFYQPIYNLLVIFYRLFGGDLALAIIAVAVLARLITFPLTMKQIRMAETSREFNDKVKAIRKEHKGDKQKETEALMKVQSEYLPGQLSGCLSLIVQLVLLINIYNVISNLFSAKGVQTFNEVAYPFVAQFPADGAVNGNILGIINLQTVGNHIGLENFVHFLPYLLLAVGAGAAQYFSNRILMGLRQKRLNDQKAKQEEREEKLSQKEKKKKQVEEEVEMPDFNEIMQRSSQQTMTLFAVLLIFMSLNLPAGLSLYWTVQSGLVIIQQLLVERFTKQNNES